tara:strand:+ start:108 stop:824 length:717 start_codon:yes stop_codon:yes gene_type:complete
MATYITLVNDLLRRLNEVTINTTDFDTVRNIQAIAKDAINSSVREILQEAQEWPFTIVTYTQALTVGTGTYDFPADFSKVDWETFYLKSLDGSTPSPLPVLTYEMYLQSYRASDDSSGTSGYSLPTCVYKTQEDKFGITPLPDKTYSIEYRYWKYPEDLVLADDVCVIPSRFKHILIDGAMMYMMRFRSNEQSANIHQDKFTKGIKSMRRLIVDSPTQLYSTVTGGFQSSTAPKKSFF